MSELERKAVESMVMSGLNIEAIYQMFASLEKDDVDSIYEAVKHNTK